jgi:2-oxoisovalerate dehydrogenase E1 component
MAVLHKLPIVYLVQDNDWGISAKGEEMRAMDAVEFSKGFKGLEALRVDGTHFEECYELLKEVFDTVRVDRRPVLVHATCPLLGHHTSGVRREFYRSDDELAELMERDPRLLMVRLLTHYGVSASQLESIEQEAKQEVALAWEQAKAAPEPAVESLFAHALAPTPVLEELGERTPAGREPVVMVDAALHAIDEIFAAHPEALLYGQDVGIRLGGVFREAATLAQKYGTHRVFNTPIQEAYIIGSTSGMAAVGLRPIVEVQFADYIWPGLNQLFTELSRSYYLSNGKWPVPSVIRVPIGAYTGGGPFHSSSVESILLNIRGIKVVYPSNAADMKGLMKAAFLDPNPVVVLEHKGLYWSKVPGTQAAKTVEPDEHYVIPLGKARLEVAATEAAVASGNSCAVVTYGMGVHWARNAVQQRFAGQVDVLDLRSLEPLDWPAIEALARKHGKVLVVTEEPAPNGFAEALAGRIGRTCFQHLDAPVEVLGSACVPGIPVNEGLEFAYLPGIEGVAQAIERLLSY